MTRRRIAVLSGIALAVVAALLVFAVVIPRESPDSSTKPAVSAKPSPSASSADATGPLGTSAAWGLTVSPDEPITTSISTDESLLGRRVDIVQRFISWSWQPSTQTSVIDALRAVSSPNRTVLITWQPGDADGTGGGSTVSLASIASGREDAAAQRFLQQLADFPGPVALRFAHEMNGSWYPWAGDPATYLRAWHRVHELVRSEAPNVKLVWSPNNDDRPAGNTLERYWPGTGEVDIIGIDGYNCLRGWQTPGAVFDSAYRRVAALDSTAPIWITETSSCEAATDVSGSSGQSKAEWITQLLATTTLPRVTAVVWFDRNKEFDWRIDSSTAASNSLKAGLNR